MLGTLWIYTLVLAFICIGTGLILFLVWDIPSLRAEVSGRARLKQVHDLTASGMGLADLYMVHNVNRDLTMSWKPVQEEMEKAAESIPEPVVVSDDPAQGIEEPKSIVSKHRALRFPEVGSDFMRDLDDSNAGGVSLLEEMLDESKPLTVPDIENMTTSLMDSDDVSDDVEDVEDVSDDGDAKYIEAVCEFRYHSDDVEDIEDDVEESPTDFMTTPDDVTDNSVDVEESPTDLMEDGFEYGETSDDYKEISDDLMEDDVEYDEISHDYEELPTSFMEDEGTFESVEETPTDTLNDVDDIEGYVDEDSYVSDEDMDDSYDDVEETPTGFIDDVEENSSTTLLDQFSNKLSTGRLDVVEEQGNYDE